MRSAFVSNSTSDDRHVAEMKSFLRAAGFDCGYHRRDEELADATAALKDAGLG